MDTEQKALSDEDYVVGLALLAAHRSKDVANQVGACLLDKNNKVVGIGYNGLPVGINDDDGGWDDKNSYECHAAINAIMFKSAISLEDCVLYVTLFPCNYCAQAIIQSGIKKVYYVSGRVEDISKTLMRKTNVKYKRYQSSLSELVIDFEEPFPVNPTKNI